MLKKRIIPSLLYRNGEMGKGVQFDNYKNVIVKDNLINNISIVYIDKETSFFGIAQNHNIALSKLKKVNENYFKNDLRPGDHVFLSRKKRKCKHAFHKVQDNESILSISHLYGVKARLISKRNGLKINEPISPGLKIYLNKKSPFLKKGSNKNYTVRSGDTLYSISNRFNITIEALKKINGLKSNKILAGMKLKLQN